MRDPGDAAPDGSPETPEEELVHYVQSLGGTDDQIEGAANLGELALNLVLRPRGSQTLRDVVSAAGADLAEARSLMTAMGFDDDPDLVLTDAEATAIDLLAARCVPLFGSAATLQLARVSGHAMARVAETLVGAFRLQVEVPQREHHRSAVDAVGQYVGLAQSSLPTFVGALDASLRRQMVRVTTQLWSTDDERSAVTVDRAVGFVDLVGFTQASTRLSVRELTEVLVMFDRLTSEVVAGQQGQIVKMIGDEAMFVTDNPTRACRIAQGLLEVFGGDHPDVRIGVASGQMVSVFGDLFGPDVNLAARLVAAAEPGSAVVSERVVADAVDLSFDPLPPMMLKGFPEPIAAFRLRAPDGDTG